MNLIPYMYSKANQGFMQIWRMNLLKPLLFFRPQARAAQTSARGRERVLQLVLI